MFQKDVRLSTINGILFVAMFAIIATYIAQFEIFKSFGISPLIIGIVLGMIYANTLYEDFPTKWHNGIVFSTKTILRTAIIFYGFRLTFSNIADVGWSGFFVAFSMVVLTFSLGYILGVKVFKMDKETTILTSAGSAICGAAAVLATEALLKSKAHKSAVAVSTVVLFGTIAMFLYPFMYRLGFIDMSLADMGIYIGGSVHEVAHVVAAGNALNNTVASDNAVISKMLRVMLLAPFLLVLGFLLAKNLMGAIKCDASTSRIPIPWFAVLFIVATGFNSLDLLPQDVVSSINTLDTFALTMAMSALGIQTSFKKFKSIGPKPFYLAFVLFLWLIFGGYFITKLFV